MCYNFNEGSDIMNKDEKIKELESRIEKLENIEKRRKIKNIVILCIYSALVVALVVILIVFYQKIKPYKDQIDSLKNFGSNSKEDTIIEGDNGMFGFDDFFNNFFNY